MALDVFLRTHPVSSTLRGERVQQAPNFLLHRIDGKKYHEIAERLNISIKTVETQMSRALFKIRVQLKDYLVMIFILQLLEQ